MEQSDEYKEGLLLLSLTVMHIDGIADPLEIKAINFLVEQENIPTEIKMKTFQQVRKREKKELYRQGIDILQHCSHEERIRAFGWLYNLLNVDGSVHMNEAMFVLFLRSSLKIDLEEVMRMAKNLPSFE